MFEDGSLADYLIERFLPEKKKRIELMMGRFSGPYHSPKISPSFPLNR